MVVEPNRVMTFGTERNSPPEAAERPGELSADGRWYWDGARWASTLSTDGLWRWDGRTWQPQPRSLGNLPGKGRSIASPNPAGSLDPEPAPNLQQRLSPDGRSFWNGTSWMPAVSADGQWRWNGTDWVAALPFWARPYASAHRRALAAQASIVIAASGSVVLALSGSGTDGVSSAVADIGGIAGVLGYVAAAIAVPMWCHRVYRNLPWLGETRLRFSSAEAAYFWFVPIWNLWRPYQILREVWMRTIVGPWTLLKVYWAMWIAGGIAETALSSVDWIPIVTTAPTAILAVLVIARITSAQESSTMRLIPTSDPIVKDQAPPGSTI
jgi:hypothetical protein